MFFAFTHLQLEIPQAKPTTKLGPEPGLRAGGDSSGDQASCHRGGSSSNGSSQGTSNGRRGEEDQRLVTSDEAHARYCLDPKRCARCRAIRRWSQWQRSLAFTHNGHKYTTLKAVPPGSPGTWALGCVACKAAQGKGSSNWAKFQVRTAICENLKLHASTKGHQLAVETLKGQAGNWGTWPLHDQPDLLPEDAVLSTARKQTSVCGPWVPAPEEFLDAVASFSGGKGARQTQAGSCSTTRPLKRTRAKIQAEIELDQKACHAPDAQAVLRKKRFCAAEALRDSWREKFVDGAVASMCHDKRNTELVILANVVHPKFLEPTGMLLGAEYAPRGASGDIRHSMNTAIRRFCTVDSDAPGTGYIGKHDPELEKRVRSAFKGAYADGCAADQKAVASMLGGDLPVCKDTARDGAHSLRSCLKRPSRRMGPQAQAKLDALVFGKESAIRMIDNSSVHKDTWQKNGRSVECPLGEQRSNFGIAPQRFDSEAKPLADVSFMTGRFLQTCADIATARRGKRDGALMAKNLRATDEASLVLVACLGEAINAGLQLTRSIFDQFRLLSERQHEAITEFLESMDALFGGKGSAWSKSRCQGLLVSHVYDFLKQPRILSFAGEQKVLGGIAVQDKPEIMKFVKYEMANWLAALHACIAAEFPEWQTSQNFRIFRLPPPGSLTGAVAKACIERLCRVLGADLRQAFEEYALVQPLAARRFEALNDEVAAWRSAVEGLEARHRKGCAAGKPRLNALRLLLAAWIALVFSSCGVEHVFTHSARLFGRLRVRLRMEKRRDELALSARAVSRPSDQVLGRKSCDVWTRCYPEARCRLMVRSDRGREKGEVKGKTTARSLRTASQAAVRRALAYKRDNAISDTGFRATSSAAKAEVKLQTMRLAKRTAAARARGHLARSDLSNKAIRKSLCLANAATNQKALVAPETKPAALPPRAGSAPLTRGRLPALVTQRLRKPQKTLYVDPALASGSAAPGQTGSLRITKQCLDADMIMCDMSNHGPRHLQLTAWLVGAKLVGANFFEPHLDGRPKPACIQFASAVGIRRLWVYFTPGAVQSRSTTIRLVREAADKPWSRWTVIQSEEALRRSLRARPTQCFAIYSAEGYAKLENPPRHAISWKMFLLGLQRPFQINGGLRKTTSNAATAAAVVG